MSHETTQNMLSDFKRITVFVNLRGVSKDQSIFFPEASVVPKSNVLGIAWNRSGMY